MICKHPCRAVEAARKVSENAAAPKLWTAEKSGADEISALNTNKVLVVTRIVQ